MKIVVLQGSPNLQGSTDLLVENFTKGAQEAGHSVRRFDACKVDVKPFGGSVACGFEGSNADDDNAMIRDAILESDMVVFASPLYYYGVTAQLKTIIDRFVSYNESFIKKHFKTALLSVGEGTDDWTFDSTLSFYQTLVRYLEMTDKGSVLAFGCGNRKQTEASKYPEQAYNLGKSL